MSDNSDVFPIAAVYQSKTDLVFRFFQVNGREGRPGVLLGSAWDGSRWVGSLADESPPATLTGSPAVGYLSKIDRVHCFTVGADGQVYVAYLDDGKWAWQGLGFAQGRTAINSPAVVHQSKSNRMRAFVVGDDGQLYRSSWSGSETNVFWTGIGRPPGTTAINSPAAAYQSKIDRVHAFVVGQDGQLYHTYQDSDQQAVHWEDLGSPPGTTVTSTPAAVYQSSLDRVHVFVVGADNELYLSLWNGSVWVWQALGTPPGTSVGFPPAAVYQPSLDRVHAFVVGSDELLYLNFWDGSRWVWQAHGAPPGHVVYSRAAVVYQEKLDRIHAFLWAGSVDLWDNFWDGSQWVWFWDALLSKRASISHSAEAMRAGATAFATLDLAEPAPTGGTLMRLTSSNPAAVQVRGNVQVPAGQQRASIPMAVAKTAGGTTAVITATGDVTLSTTVKVLPDQSQTLRLGSGAGLIAPVNGLVVDGTTIYATHYLSKAGSPKTTLGAGTVAVVTDGTTLTEKLPRFPAGFGPRSIAVNPAIGCVYVANGGQESFNLSILDQTTGRDVAGSPVPIGQVPFDVAVNTRTGRVYLSNWFSGKVTVLEPVPGNKQRLHRTIAETDIGRGGEGLAVDATSGRVYIAQALVDAKPPVHAIVVLDADGQRIDTFTHRALFGPIDVAIATVGDQSLVCAATVGFPPSDPDPIGASIVVFNADAPSKEPMVIPTGSPRAALAARGNTLFATAPAGLEVIDLTAARIRMIMPAGKAPASVAVSTISDAVYVGDGVEGTLTRLILPNPGTPTFWS